MTPKLLPLIKTAHFAATRQFYLDKLGFGLSMAQEGYMQLHHGTPEGPELCFTPPGNEQTGVAALSSPFGGTGLVFSIPVPDVDAKYQALRAAGVADLTAPSNKPWGVRSVYVTDPNGVVLDFYQPIVDSAASAAV